MKASSHAFDRGSILAQGASVCEQLQACVSVCGESGDVITAGSLPAYRQSDWDLCEKFESAAPVYYRYFWLPKSIDSG